MHHETPRTYLHASLTKSILAAAIRVQDTLGPMHQAQLLTYLRLARKEVGLLLNFWARPLKDGGIQRLILIEQQP